MDPDAKVWKELEEADIVTMYFVTEALEKIRPRLEAALADSKCRVITCGYAMPQWEPRWTETILGLPVCLYEFGTPALEEPRPLTPKEHEQALKEHLSSISQSGGGGSFLKQPYEDAEKIKIPLIDESEMVDFHWDDFDQEPPDDLDENPAIPQWRKPE